MKTPQTPVVDPTLLDSLRDDLDAAGFTVPSVEGVLGPVAAAALHREHPVAARRALQSQDSPVATLTALFLLGGQVPRRRAEAAFSRLGVAGAERLGVVSAAGHGPDDSVRATVDLRPYAATDAAGPIAWWLASDLGEAATGGRLRADHVLGAGGASLTLAQVTSREPVGSVLDLGTGCGIQALHAARHAGRVVATDISARALGFAAFNAALNGVNLDLRRGSMLDPVAGEAFDLVVSNPPFVITPRGSSALPDYEYRDGGRSGDDVVADLIRQVGTVLAPGGTAQLLGNWEIRRGQLWTERVGQWLEESGLDGWVVQREVLDPAQYAETWLRDGGTTPEREPARWSAAYEEWLDDFAVREVDGVGFGIVTLRRPESGADAGIRVRRLEENLGTVRQPLGPAIAASLTADRWLSAHDDLALAESHLVTATDVTEERHYTPGTPDPRVVLLHQGSGFGRTVRASSGLAALVGACDGELTVGQIVTAIAALLDVDAADLSAELFPQVRMLLRDGFLTVDVAA